jgi:hypothetical protein
MSEQTTVPHSHYIVVAEQLEERTEQLHRKLAQEREIKELLRDAGLSTILEEEGSCITRPLVDHIRHMVVWQKDVQKVRDALRGELERKGYTTAQLRELCGLPADD